MFKKILTSKKKSLQLPILSLLIVIASLFISNYLVKHTTQTQIYHNVNEVSHNRVGLVLGTSKYLKSRYKNAYYVHRINATVNLYKAGKIDYVLISGDNSTVYYDEPNTFKNQLIKRGIPTDKIYLDYAGFRTLDSVVRANKAFGLSEFTIISQKFHIERALYIANHKNIKAIRFVANDVSTKYGFKTLVREKFARVKLMIDLLFNIQPKFLGEPIQIGQ